MDKQMIEEMAKIIDIDCGECYTCDYYDKEDKGLPANCTCFLQARELYNAGYRKIPEGAVVVTKSIWDEHIEQRERTMKVFENRVREETAEKFAERAKEEAFVVFMGEPIIRARKIDEICKEITEGSDGIT